MHYSEIFKEELVEPDTRYFIFDTKGADPNTAMQTLSSSCGKQIGLVKCD
jgi:hypothetical protein